MKLLLKVFFATCIISVILCLNISTIAKEPKAKFYDFSEQLIDGEINKPTSLYLDARKKVIFNRLLKLKKSFLPKLFDTAKERVFK